MAAEWNRATFTIDNILHDEDNYINAIQSFLTQSGWELASWSGTLNDLYFLRTDRNVQPRWQYTGDGPLQHGGIHVFYDSDPNTTTGTSLFTGEEHIVFKTFLENTGATGVQIETPDHVGLVGSGAAQSNRFGSCRINYDPSAPNNVLIIGGEDGLYLEAGRDSSANNLGHLMIATFGAIPELRGVYDDNVRWTAQGMVGDLFDSCRCTRDRNNRWVVNDSSDKNITSSLQFYTPRGTSNIETPTLFDQQPYFIGSRDSIVGMGVGNINRDIQPPTSSTNDCSLQYHATFGLANSPEAGRFRISPLLMVQDLEQVNVAAVSTLASDNVLANGNFSQWLDPRRMRQVFRFAAADYTLLPFANVQDGATGAVYRITRVEDDGRFSKLGIEWPGGAITVLLT